MRPLIDATEAILVSLATLTLMAVTGLISYALLA